MTRNTPRWVLCTAIAGILAAAAQTSYGSASASRAGIDRLKSEYAGAKVSVSPATGGARFVRLSPSTVLSRGTVQAENIQKQFALSATAGSFIDRHAAAFGLANGIRDLELRRSVTDRLGQTHLSYAQQYKGVPVFGSSLKAHFDAAGRLTVLNGVIIPDIDLSTTPTHNLTDVQAAAVAAVKRNGTSARESRLVIYREGLAKGVPGANHLAYEVLVTNGRNVREFVYVDAHTGKVVDRIKGIQDAKYRRAYDAGGATAPGPNYPATPFWVENDAFPTGNVEADNMIAASSEAYDFYFNAFGRDSFDGAGAIMDSIFNRGNGCPNASWGGVFISFCPGTTSDDVTVHEWSHAYTQYTDGLIYAWQPGALNEASSDIFGETVDQINGRQTDAPNAARAADACTTFTTLPPTLRINSPAAIAGVKPSGGAAFGPQTFSLTSDVVLVNDGTGIATPPLGVGGAGDLSVMDGCETPFANAASVNGKIAMIYRGTCGFAVKVKNAQLNGATGVIIANHAAGGNGAINMAGVDPTITIPSLSVGNANGEAIRTQLASTTVNASLVRGGTGSDNSVRWLMGEDASAFGGAIRDMYSPNCYNNPAKVSDALYTCSTADSGGVHSNSGVDNHAYALMVDGGTFNGQTVTGIGLTKAAHIYFRAKTAYQHPATDFADHADALEQSCADLTGTDLASLTTGASSGQVISTANCVEVHKAIQAVEFRTPPSQCNFQPLLAQNPPPLCAAPTKTAKMVFSDNFESGDSWTDRWAVSHEGPPDFPARDWSVVGGLPHGRPGRAFFGPTPEEGTCAAGGDASAVLHLDSKQISLANTVGDPMLTFMHSIGTEAGFDGGNLKISVNGGPWQVVAASAFSYNAYNATLINGGNSNPLHGQPAFTGGDGGSVDSIWGRTIVNLKGYAKSKDKIQLRFDVGKDCATGYVGWYVDDVSIYQCR